MASDIERQHLDSAEDSLLEKGLDIAHNKPNDTKMHLHYSRGNPYKMWQILVGTVLLLPTILGLITIARTIQHHFIPDAFDPYQLMVSECSCGSTIEEALAMGCKFDVWAEAWVPPECQDEFLQDKFNVAGSGINGSFPYFLDVEGTQPVSLGEMEMMLGTRIYTSRAWHVAHCLFYWIKEWRAREVGKKMEQTYFSMYHVQHCVEFIMETDGKDWSALTGQFDIKLTSKLRSELQKEQAAQIWEM